MFVPPTQTFAKQLLHIFVMANFINIYKEKNLYKLIVLIHFVRHIIDQLSNPCLPQINETREGSIRVLEKEYELLVIPDFEESTLTNRGYN